MTSDVAVCTGERRRRRTESNRQFNRLAGDRGIRALASVPALDWPADLFTSAIADDDAFDSELTPNDGSRVPGREAPKTHAVFGDDDPVTWPYQSGHASMLAGVAP
jgi:hypothetical protein